MTQNNKVKIGFIGAGSMAREHLKAFSSISEIEIEAICSRTKEKAIKLSDEFGNPKVYENIADMLINNKLDIIVITVNIDSMKSVCLECFSYSPDSIFLIEKPLGKNLEEAEIVALKARESNIRAFVAFNRRFYSSSLAVKEDLETQSGPMFIKIQDQEDLISAVKDGHPKEVIENWMFANSIHLIDMILYFSRSRIKSIMKVNPLKYSLSDFFTHHVFVHFENGDTALYEGIWNAQGPWAVTVTTPDKRYELKPIEQAAYQNFPSRERFEFQKSEDDMKFKPGFYLQAINTILAFKNQENGLASLEKALETTKLVHSMFFEK